MLNDDPKNEVPGGSLNPHKRKTAGQAGAEKKLVSESDNNSEPPTVDLFSRRHKKKTATHSSEPEKLTSESDNNSEPPSRSLFSKRHKKKTTTHSSEPEKAASSGVRPRTSTKSEAKIGKDIRIISKGLRRRPTILRLILQILFAIVVLIGLTYVLFIFVLKKPIPIFKREKKIYSLSIYSKSEKAIFEMKKIARENNFEFKTKKLKKYNKQKNGFRVVQKFSSEKAARRYPQYLKKKGIPARMFSDPEEGIYVRAWGVFKTKKEAVAHCVKATRVMKTAFNVEESFRKIPYTIFMLEVTGIPEKKEAEKLEDRFREFDPESIKISEEVKK